ncbi:MAG: MarR family transcriptional regulator [Labilithrix sp.]|nr:MarR family transcriptional regulator [Labilithrix sp.]MCW5813676.1 MarR family transcriptional regulator [Labilithrix sp.]
MGTFETKLEEEKARSTVQLLFKAARLLNERAIATLRERTKQPIRTAHTAVLPHIDLEGTRLTDLAAKLGVTKQAAGQLVDELVALGQLERIPDPADARAKLIRFSKRGRAGLLEGLATLQALEADLTTLIGAPAMKTLHDALAKIIHHEQTHTPNDR